MTLMDWLKAHADVFLAVFFVGTAIVFILRRMFGGLRSAEFAAFEQRHPRAAATITLLEGLFAGLTMIAGAVYQLVTGKPPPVIMVTPEEPPKAVEP